MFPYVADGAEYSHSMVFHDSKLPQPDSYPPTSTSFSRATIPARADHGVVALSFEIESSEPVRYLVFFLREALARLFQQEEQECPLPGEWEHEREGAGAGAGAGTEGEPCILDWDDWGPQASRWFVAPSFEQWRCSVHGYRFVTLVTRFEARADISPSFPQVVLDSNDPVPEPLHLLVFDFNPYPLRRHLPQDQCPSDNGNGNGNGNGTTVVIAPSDVTLYDWENRFERDVNGRLACRVTLMEEPADYAALAACEDNIIGIQVRRANTRTHTYRYTHNKKTLRLLN